MALFGLPFAVNSSLHSYLILAYAGSEKAAEDVGFYYAANAAGRLGGILLSGLLYQWGGIVACLAGSAAMLVISWLITFLLPVAPTVIGGAATGLSLDRPSACRPCRRVAARCDTPTASEKTDGARLPSALRRAAASPIFMQ